MCKFYDIFIAYLPFIEWSDSVTSLFLQRFDTLISLFHWKILITEMLS
jgi:hypothetical protein